MLSCAASWGAFLSGGVAAALVNHHPARSPVTRFGVVGERPGSFRSRGHNRFAGGSPSRRRKIASYIDLSDGRGGDGKSADEEQQGLDVLEYFTETLGRAVQA